MQQKIIVEITVDWEDYQDVDPELIFEDTGMPSAAKEGVTYKVLPPPSSHQGDFITDMEAEVAKRYSDPESEFAQDFEIGASWAKEYLSPPAPPTPVEGPWSWQVVGSRTNDERGDEYDEYYELTDGKTTFYIDGGEDDDSFDKLVQLLNDHKIKLDFDHGAEFLAYEFERMYKEAVEQRPQWMHTDWHRPEKAGYYFVDVEQIGKRVWGKRKIIHEAENGRRFYWLSDSAAPEQVDVIDAYKEYIQLLTDELSELAGMAAVHGWKSTRYEKGVELRNKIESLQNKL